MKKFFSVMFILLSVSVLFSSCAVSDYASESGGQLVNAENYGGLGFAEPRVSVKAPKDIPVPTTAKTPSASPKTKKPSSSQTAPAAQEGDSVPALNAPNRNSGNPQEPAPVPDNDPTVPAPAVSSGNSGSYTPLNHGEVVGVWISYIELGSILTGKSESHFRQSYAAMMDNCRSLGINTVYVHLRPFGDALYESDHYPWSKYVSGKVGKTPAFDPLKIMLEESHSRGISFHGWINPMRIQSDGDISAVSGDYLIGQWFNDDSKKGKYVVKHGNNWYLNPAYEEVIRLIGNGAAEIPAKYNVDGIHIDDYFYPTTETSFDADAYRNASFSSLDRFRLFNCNNMVKTMYASVKTVNSGTLFGISPQGSVENNYNQLYADVETWCKSSGYADYIAPQFYYGFNNALSPYTQCINRWQAMINANTGSGIKLIAGLAVYKIGAEDTWAGSGSQEWLTDKQIIRRQIQEARTLSSYGGVVFYSYNYLFSPEHVTAVIQEEIDAFKPLL